MGNWAFNWVQILAHNIKPLSIRLVILLAVMSYGLLDFNWQALSPLAAQLSIAFVAIAVLMAWLTESIKTAVLLLLLSLVVLLASFGLMGWFDLSLTHNGVLAILVVVMMVAANLVHVLHTLLREMARGLFQFDAVAEALKMNFQPIFLSNLTTAFGFLFAGWLNPELMEMGWVVLIGAVMSLFITLTLLPLLLLSFLLEFRVGNSADRHGFRKLIDYLETKLHWHQPIMIISGLLTLVLLILSYQSLFSLQMLAMLFLFAVLFWLYWSSPKLVFVSLWLTLMAWLLSYQINLVFAPILFSYLPSGEAAQSFAEIGPFILMLSLGLIIDDVVHFFSRYHFAQQGVFRDSLSAVKFAMASVARPIWITSWLLAITMLVLLFNSEPLIASAALLTLTSVIVVTLMVLLWLPLVLTKKS